VRAARFEDGDVTTFRDDNDQPTLGTFVVEVFFEALPEKPGLAANDAVIGGAVTGGTAEDVDTDLLLVNITGAPFDETGADEL
jgi:hypothetical protein